MKEVVLACWGPIIFKRFSFYFPNGNEFVYLLSGTYLCFQCWCSLFTSPASHCHILIMLFHLLASVICIGGVVVIGMHSNYVYVAGSSREGGGFFFEKLRWYLGTLLYSGSWSNMRLGFCLRSCNLPLTFVASYCHF